METENPQHDSSNNCRSPCSIPYSGTISLKDFKDERISQLTTVGWFPLIPDDGCDIIYTTVRGEEIKWLKEHGQGHDISKGRKDCPHVLESGSYHVQINYSQTYYNPKPGTWDLDGISLVVAPVVVDIFCIGEGTTPGRKNHLFLEKRTQLRIAVNKIYLAKSPFGDSGGVPIKWEAQIYSRCPQRFNGVILARNQNSVYSLPPPFSKQAHTVNMLHV